MEKAIQMAKDKIADEIKCFAKKETLTPEEVKCFGEFIDMAKDIVTMDGMYGGASTDHERQIVDKWIKKMRAEEV